MEAARKAEHGRRAKWQSCAGRTFLCIQPRNQFTGAGLIQSVAFFAAIVLSLPALLFAALGLLNPGVHSWPLVTLVVGMGLGLVLLALGVFWGGRIFTRRAPELLAFTLRQ